MPKKLFHYPQKLATRRSGNSKLPYPSKPFNPLGIVVLATALALPSLVPTSSTFAEAPDLPQLWSFDEALEVRDEYDEILAKCNFWKQCSKDIIDDRIEQGDAKAKIAQYINDSAVAPLKLNPSTMKVSFFYNDRSYFLANREDILETDEPVDHATLRGLTVAWYKKDLDRFILYTDYASLIPQQKIHTMFGYINFDDDLSHKLVIDYTTDTCSWSRDEYDLSSCIYSDDYHNGMDCVLYYDLDTGPVFVPEEPAESNPNFTPTPIPDPNPAPSPVPTPDPDPDLNPSPDLNLLPDDPKGYTTLPFRDPSQSDSSSSPQAPATADSTSSQLASASTVGNQTTAPNPPLAPNTGAVSFRATRPFWHSQQLYIAVVALLLFSLVLSVQKAVKNCQKSLKNRGKIVDNYRKVR